VDITFAIKTSCLSLILGTVLAQADHGKIRYGILHEFTDGGKNMKSIVMVLVLVSLSTVSFAADSSTSCKNIYRTGSNNILDLITSFKNKEISAGELAIQKSAISTEVSMVRAGCHFSEDPAIGDCVNRYRGIYNELSEKVNSISILLGNQKDVDMSRFSSAIYTTRIDAVDLLCQ
jgi:hypothetical protein